jgi:hypothetical protein
MTSLDTETDGSVTQVVNPRLGIILVGRSGTDSRVTNSRPRCWVVFSPALRCGPARLRLAVSSRRERTSEWHSSIRITMDRYGHLFPGQDEALAERLDTLRPECGFGIFSARSRPRGRWFHYKGPLTRANSFSGEVAQLAEHATENRGVGSSILPLATKSGREIFPGGCPSRQPPFVFGATVPRRRKP